MLLVELHFCSFSITGHCALWISIRDLILKPYIDLITLYAHCALEFSIIWDLDFHGAVACDMVSSTISTLVVTHCVSCTSSWMNALFPPTLASPCDEKETGERRVADARRGWFFVLGQMIKRRLSWHWKVWRWGMSAWKALYRWCPLLCTCCPLCLVPCQSAVWDTEQQKFVKRQKVICCMYGFLSFIYCIFVF